jgi:hydrogenase/urease accessory protein HupE
MMGRVRSSAVASTVAAAARRLVGLFGLIGLVVPVVLASRVAGAHQSTATFGEVARGSGPGEILWRLRVRTVDLAAAIGPRPRSGAPAAAPSDAAATRARVARYLQAGMHVDLGGQPCALLDFALAPAPAAAAAAAGAPASEPAPAPEPSWELRQRFQCPPGDDRAIGLRYDLFFERDPYHESFTRLELGQPDSGARGGSGDAGAPSSTSTVVFWSGLRQIAVSPREEPSAWRSGFLYLRLGILHILTGYDHLSFLMAVLLGAALSRRTTAGSEVAAASLREALTRAAAAISAFTVAHSVSLIAQVLRPGWITTRWVEPAIALSVAYVGLENLIPRAPRHRALLVFGFGLVHGLGFASVLREVGLPRRALVLCLLSFNLGVELGQLLVLALTFPLILMAARWFPRRFERWGLQLGSAAIAALGVVWLVARLTTRGPG